MTILSVFVTPDNVSSPPTGDKKYLPRPGSHSLVNAEGMFSIRWSTAEYDITLT